MYATYIAWASRLHREERRTVPRSHHSSVTRLNEDISQSGHRKTDEMLHILWLVEYPTASQPAIWKSSRSGLFLCPANSKRTCPAGRQEHHPQVDRLTVHFCVSGEDGDVAQSSLQLAFSVLGSQ